MCLSLEITDTLQRLCAAPGPSGFEGPAAALCLSLLRPLMDEVWTDRFGNVVGLRRCGRENAKKLLLDAHMDEIGLIVTGVEEGFLLFDTIGGVDLRVLPDREVTVLAPDPLFGVVTCLPPHVQAHGDQDKAFPVSELRIDAGLSDERARALVPVGTPVVFRAASGPLGGGLFSGRALDDRAGIAVLLRAAELISGEKQDVDLYLMASTREETGGAGAAAGAFSLAPDCCVAVDATHGKTPDTTPARDRVLDLGGGPAVGVGPNMTRWVSNRFFDKARELAIPAQAEVMPGHSGTNAWLMQICREGIPTGVLSVPLRYMHSPVETVSLDDLEHAARLLAAFAERLDGEALTC